jgi:hypothetical protein
MNNNILQEQIRYYRDRAPEYPGFSNAENRFGFSFDVE